MSYQTSSKRSPPFWLLIGARKTQVFWHQSEARTATTVWNWSGKTLSPGALLAVLYFSSCHIFFRPFRLFLVPTICPWVSEDGERICVTLKHTPKTLNLPLVVAPCVLTFQYIQFSHTFIYFTISSQSEH